MVNMKNSSQEIAQKIKDTLMDKLSNEVTFDDLDYAALTLLRLKEHDGDKEIIRGKVF